MLRKSKNELTLTVDLQGTSPLMIKDGRWKNAEMGNSKLPAMIFLSRTPLSRLTAAVSQDQLGLVGFEYFIPGASIRGAWRAHLEKVLRSLDDDPKVCDPIIAETDPVRGETPSWLFSCSSNLLNDEDPAPLHPYRDSCPICRLFGNTAQASRLSFSDATKTGGTAVDLDNNAISRQTGAAISPFKSRVILDARFTFELTIRNFELWHLGLLACLFADLEAGRVRLGAGKSKGWGQVKAAVSSLKLTYFGLDDPFEQGKLLGIGETMSPEALLHYGISAAPTPPALPPFSKLASSPWRHTVQIDDAALFWPLCRPFFSEETWASFSKPAGTLAPATPQLPTPEA